MFAIKSARQWTNTDSLVRARTRFNKYPPINFLSPFTGFSPLSPSSPPPPPPLSPLLTSSTNASSTTSPWWWRIDRANGTISSARGRPRVFVHAFILRLLSGTRRRRFTQTPYAALCNRPLPALVCISLTLTLAPILAAVSSISPCAATRRGIGAVDAGINCFSRQTGLSARRIPRRRKRGANGDVRPLRRVNAD